LPHWLRVVSEYSPFRFMLSVPVELMTESLSATEVLGLMAAQAGWAVATLGLALGLWRAGVRKFEAVGN
jgi:ABC-2 type transport system permease protein